MATQQARSRSHHHAHHQQPQTTAERIQAHHKQGFKLVFEGISLDEKGAKGSDKTAALDCYLRAKAELMKGLRIEVLGLVFGLCSLLSCSPEMISSLFKVCIDSFVWLRFLSWMKLKIRDVNTRNHRF
jgi:hypothetical protein